MAAKRLALRSVKARLLRGIEVWRVPRGGRTDQAHPESAAWALGALDPDEAARFELHLRTCVHCQAAIAELGPITQVLRTATPVPTGRPAPDFEAPTIPLRARPGGRAGARAAGQVRAGAAGRAGVPARQGRAVRWGWRGRDARLLTAAAAVGAATVLVAGLVLLPRLEASPAGAVTIPLHGVAGRASGTAVAHHRAGGWSITLSVHGLKDLGAGRYYECWYAGPGRRPGHRELIPAGTFTTGRADTVSITMWSAADPSQFPTMEITAEAPGDGRQHGLVVLTGMART
jgi:hypothetical protein